MAHHDDEQQGQVLSRREVLASLGALGAAAFLPHGAMPVRQVGRRILLPGGVPLPGCIVRPAQTEGPYFVDENLNRTDIRNDPVDGKLSEGPILRLQFRVSTLDGAACAPLTGAVVDVWQCDALGVYSDVKDFQGRFDTTGKKFLRGHQVTGTDGVASFVTVYPGHYSGRTVHIHFKIRTDPASSRGMEFTSQLYFDDAFSDGVFKHPAYAGNRQRRTRNGDDGIYRQGGQELMLDVQEDGMGYRTSFDLALKPG